jgi:hypothetical protein
MSTNRMSAAEFRAQFGSKIPSTVTNHEKPPIRLPKENSPNKTEGRYGDVLAIEFKVKDGYSLQYECLSLKLKDGTRYTPDWIVWKGPEIILAVECKGSFKLGSNGRSVAAFKRAISDFPNIKFRWAQDTSNGWNVVDSK